MLSQLKAWGGEFPFSESIRNLVQMILNEKSSENIYLNNQYGTTELNRRTE